MATINMKQLNTKILLRTDTTAGWENAVQTALPEHIVLLKGEIGIEILSNDKKKIKVGDGVTPWEDLEYFGSSAAIVDTKNPSTESADIGTIWVNTAGNTIWVCTSLNHWEQLGTAEDANTTYELLTDTSNSTGIIHLKNSDSVENDTKITLKGDTTIKVTSDESKTVTIKGIDVSLSTIQSSTEGQLKFTKTLPEGSAQEAIIKFQKDNDNIAITSGSDGIIKFNVTDTGATNVSVDGTGDAVNEAEYSASERKIILHKKFTQAPVNISDASVTKGIVTSVKKGEGSHDINIEKSITYSTDAPTELSDDTTLPTAKAVYTLVNTKISENDAMRYCGVVDKLHDLPSEYKKGDTYKVAYAKQYANTYDAQTGDLFIAKNNSNEAHSGWDLIPSGDDGNTFHDVLKENALVLGKDGKTIKSLPNGNSNDILKMSGGIPTWIPDVDHVYKAGTDLSLTEDDGSHVQTFSVAYTKENITSQLNNDKENILVLNGGKATGWN